MSKDDLIKYAKRDHSDQVGETSFHIDPENNSILKNIDPTQPKDKNSIKVCIAGKCFTLNKDAQGNYNWPGQSPVPALPPPEPVKTPDVVPVVPVVHPVLHPNFKPLPRKKLEHSTNFTFIFLRPMHNEDERGEFVIKKLTHQRWLDLVFHEFDEQVRRNEGADILLVSHKKVVKHTGHINSAKMQALVGYAITKGYLKFKSAYENDPSKTFNLSFKDRPMIDTNFKVFSVDKYCAEDYQAKVRMNGKAYAIPLCPRGNTEQTLKMFKFANRMHRSMKRELSKRKPWKSYALIGEFVMSRENKLSSDCNQEHLTEEELKIKWRWGDADECLECIKTLQNSMIH